MVGGTIPIYCVSYVDRSKGATEIDAGPVGGGVKIEGGPGGKPQRSKEVLAEVNKIEGEPSRGATKDEAAGSRIAGSSAAVGPGLLLQVYIDCSMNFL